MLNENNECATIDRVLKPSLLQKLKEAFEAIANAKGFGTITITVERDRPIKVATTVSELVKDE